jgi:hypothetical protein
MYVIHSLTVRFLMVYISSILLVYIELFKNQDDISAVN